MLTDKSDQKSDEQWGEKEPNNSDIIRTDTKKIASE